MQFFLEVLPIEKLVDLEHCIVDREPSNRPAAKSSDKGAHLPPEASDGSSGGNPSPDTHRLSGGFYVKLPDELEEQF